MQGGHERRELKENGFELKVSSISKTFVFIREIERNKHFLSDNSQSNLCKSIKFERSYITIPQSDNWNVGL